MQIMIARNPYFVRFIPFRQASFGLTILDEDKLYLISCQSGEKRDGKRSRRGNYHVEQSIEGGARGGGTRRCTAGRNYNLPALRRCPEPDDPLSPRGRPCYQHHATVVVESLQKMAPSSAEQALFRKLKGSHAV